MSQVKFSQERLLKVILGPVVSEKSTQVADSRGQFVFRVATDATKAEIKNAVEVLFKKDVDSVQVVNVRRSEEHTLNSSHTVNSYAAFCLKKKTHTLSCFKTKTKADKRNDDKIIPLIIRLYSEA